MPDEETRPAQDGPRPENTVNFATGGIIRPAEPDPFTEAWGRFGRERRQRQRIREREERGWRRDPIAPPVCQTDCELCEERLRRWEFRQQRARERQNRALLAEEMAETRTQRRERLHEVAVERLLSILTPLEREYYDKFSKKVKDHPAKVKDHPATQGQFVMIVSQHKRLYKINMAGIHGNVHEMDHHGCFKQSLCGAPQMYANTQGTRPLPYAEAWLGQVLTLRFNEDKYLSKALPSVYGKCGVRLKETSSSKADTVFDIAPRIPEWMWRDDLWQQLVRQAPESKKENLARPVPAGRRRWQDAEHNEYLDPDWEEPESDRGPVVVGNLAPHGELQFTTYTTMARYALELDELEERRREMNRRYRDPF